MGWFSKDGEVQSVGPTIDAVSDSDASDVEESDGWHTPEVDGW